MSRELPGESANEGVGHRVVPVPPDAALQVRGANTVLQRQFLGNREEIQVSCALLIDAVTVHICVQSVHNIATQSYFARRR